MSESEFVKGPVEQPRSAGSVDRVFGYFVAGLGVLGSVCIMALAVLINADVLSREILHSPIGGVPEIVAMMMVSIVFLQLGQAVRAERMTRNGSFLNHLTERRPAVGHAMEALFSLFGCVVFVMIFITTIRYFMFAWNSDQYFGGVLGVFIPVWPVKAVTLIGSLAVGCQFAVRTHRHLLAIIGGRRS